MYIVILDHGNLDTLPTVCVQYSVVYTNVVQCVRAVTFKTKLACIETWQCYAPAALDGHHGNKRIITIRRLATVSFGEMCVGVALHVVHVQM